VSCNHCNHSQGLLVCKINPLQQEQVVVACTKQGRWVDKAGKLTIDVSTLITDIAAATYCTRQEVCGINQFSLMRCLCFELRIVTPILLHPQVSKDGTNWTVLYDHQDDQSLNEPGSTATWKFPPQSGKESQGWRHIRCQCWKTFFRL